jgi:hypothetical protein
MQVSWYAFRRSRFACSETRGLSERHDSSRAQQSECLASRQTLPRTGQTILILFQIRNPGADSTICRSFDGGFSRVYSIGRVSPPGGWRPMARCDTGHATRRVDTVARLRAARRTRPSIRTDLLVSRLSSVNDLVFHGHYRCVLRVSRRWTRTKATRRVRKARRSRSTSHSSQSASRLYSLGILRSCGAAPMFGDSRPPNSRRAIRLWHS